MCFVPVASIITAATEIGISSYLFKKIKDKRLYPIAFFVLLLGIYQFTEYMLCVSSNPIIWARIGFATYTLMPALLYHFFINAGGGKINKFIYSIPFFFLTLSLFYPNFISYTSCNLLHVTVESLIFNRSSLLMFIYLLYYLYFPIKGVLFFSHKLNKNDESVKIKLGVLFAPLALLGALMFYLSSTIFGANESQTWLHTSVLIITGILILMTLFLFVKKNNKYFYRVNSFILATVGVVIISLYFLLPGITLDYSSIFCQFALLYSVAALLLVDSLDGNINNAR